MIYAWIFGIIMAILALWSCFDGSDTNNGERRRTSMNAPNKIYIPQHNIEAGTIQELCELIVEGSVEYIRKDALLEWLEDMRFMANSERVGAYQNVIDKLNEM